MKRYLDDVIATQSARRRERINRLLEESRVGKQVLSAIVERLNNSVGGIAPINLQKEPEGGLVGSVIQNNVRELSTKMRELYGLANLISTLLTSHAEIMETEIASLESEISAMEKVVQQHGFLLSDTRSYNASYIETFDDDVSREIDNFPDRTIQFGLHEQAQISDGFLRLPQQSSATSLPLQPKILRSNCSDFALESNDISFATTNQGWRQVVVTPEPITTNLDPDVFERNGAQVEVSLEMTEVALGTSITLSPRAGVPVEVLSIKIYSELGGQPLELLNGPRTLVSATSFHYPARPTAEVRVVVNQPVYRTRTQFDDIEDTYGRQLARLNRSSLTLPSGDEVSSFHEGIARGLLRFSPQDYSSSPGGGDYAVRRLDPQHARAALLRAIWHDFNGGSLSSGNNRIEEGLMQLRDLISQGYGIEGNNDPFARDNLDTPSEGLSPTIRTDVADSVVDGYFYDIGLQDVSVNLTPKGNRGVWVSKPLDVQGQASSIKLQATDINYALTLGELDSKLATSVEYSVCVSDDVMDERNWHPIMPSGVSQVEGERLIFSDAGSANLRFSADSSAEFKVFRDGKLMDAYTAQGSAPGTISKIRLLDAVGGDRSVYTVNYTPAGNPSVVNIDKIFSEQNQRVTAVYDDDGLGESFSGTGPSNMVKLAHSPYIDRSKLGSIDYDPVEVELSDGSIAVNTTNYEDGSLIEGWPDDGNYYFRQNGNVLVFNRAITIPFRVYYSHLQDEVRYRVVLRSNNPLDDGAVVSPEVDLVQLKVKTRE